MIDYVQERCSKMAGAVAYIYFDFGKRKSQSVDKTVASLVKQLVSKLSNLPDHLSGLFDECKSLGKGPKFNDLQVTFNTASTQLSPTFLIFDALDEASAVVQTDLLEWIESLAKSGVRTLITSRPHISGILEINPMVLQIRAQRADLENYLDETLKSQRRIRSAIKNEIKERLLENDNEM